MSAQKHRSGQTIGNWTLESQIGKGGNGVVWRCRDSSGREAAAKVLKSDLLQSHPSPYERDRRSRRVQRFVDEIKFLRQHQSCSGVVPLIDSFLPDIPSAESPPWFVMPIAVPLLVHLEVSGPSLSDIVSIFRDVAGTLASLHENSAFHRDIKPDNILMLNGEVLLSDFGLVEFAGKEANTASDEFLGPAFYIAPEMMSGPRDASPGPADVYSLAKSLWVACTGQRYPMPGEQRIGVAALTLSAYVTDSRAKLLDSLLDRCTRHDASERPTCREVFDELHAWSEKRQPNLTPLSRIVALKDQIAPSNDRHVAELRERQRSIEWGNYLIELIAEQLTPLRDALNQIGFIDSLGNEIPTRVVAEENSDLWDGWLHKRPLLPLHDVDCIWRGAAGTISQAMRFKRGSLMMCGIRIAVVGGGTALICAANVVTANGSDESTEITWTSGTKRIDTGTAMSTTVCVSLVDEVIAHSHQAVRRMCEIAGIFPAI